MLKLLDKIPEMKTNKLARIGNWFSSVKLLKRIAVIFIGITILWIFTYSKIASMEINPYHVDGAFQTASGLFRLADGNLPGKDFLPYLGIGPIFILYPFFWLFGETLQASNMASELVTKSMYFLVFFTVPFLVFKENRIFYAGLIGSFLTSLLIIINANE